MQTYVVNLSYENLNNMAIDSNLLLYSYYNDNIAIFIMYTVRSMWQDLTGTSHEMGP